MKISIIKKLIIAVIIIPQMTFAQTKKYSEMNTSERIMYTEARTFTVPGEYEYKVWRGDNQEAIFGQRSNSNKNLKYIRRESQLTPWMEQNIQFPAQMTYGGGYSTIITGKAIRIGDAIRLYSVEGDAPWIFYYAIDEALKSGVFVNPNSKNLDILSFSIDFSKLRNSPKQLTKIESYTPPKYSDEESTTLWFQHLFGEKQLQTLMQQGVTRIKAIIDVDIEGSVQIQTIEFFYKERNIKPEIPEFTQPMNRWIPAKINGKGVGIIHCVTYDLI